MNAMMWVRGFAADYDEWGDAAGEAWSYAGVEKYFDAHRGAARWWSPRSAARAASTAAWLSAVAECGYRTEAPNQAAPEGFCETQVTQRRGARWSTADAYLKPVLRRPNLTAAHRRDGHPRAGRRTAAPSASSTSTTAAPASRGPAARWCCAAVRSTRRNC